MGNLPERYILSAGYYPDSFASHGLAPDVFFTHVDLAEDEVHGYWTTLHLCAQNIVCGVEDKYKFERGTLDHRDLFWSCSPGPGVSS